MEYVLTAAEMKQCDEQTTTEYGIPSLVLMEQLRTIDKRRLETYIGHLEEQHIRRLNRALAVSVELWLAVATMEEMELQ